LIEWYLTTVQPILDGVEGLDWNGVDMLNGAAEVLEDNDHVEVFESELISVSKYNVRKIDQDLL